MGHKYFEKKKKLVSRVNYVRIKSHWHYVCLSRLAHIQIHLQFPYNDNYSKPVVTF